MEGSQRGPRKVVKKHHRQVNGKDRKHPSMESMGTTRVCGPNEKKKIPEMNSKSSDPPSIHKKRRRS